MGSKSENYVSLEKVEARQYYLLGIFSVLACIAIAVTIYTFNSRISVLEEKTNNLQNIIELYEKNKEIKEENEKYYKALNIDKAVASNSPVIIVGE